MRQKLIALWMLIGVLTTSIIGCGLLENNSNKREVDLTQTEWNTENLGDNLYADFIADVHATNKLDTYTMIGESVDVEKVKQVFWTQDENSFEIESRYYEPEMPELGYVYMLATADGLEIISNYELMHGETKEAAWYRNFLSYDADAWDENNRPAQLGDNQELDFLNKEEIATDITKNAKTLFPDLDVESMEFYTLSSDYLNELQESALAELQEMEDQEWYEREKKLKKDWKEEEGAYYITVDFSLDELPISSIANSQLADGRGIEGYMAAFIYNQNGCVYADMPSGYSIEKQLEGEVLPVAQALELLRQDLTSVILTREYTISDGKLQYLYVSTPSTTKVEFIPVWTFTTKTWIEIDKGDESYEYYDYEDHYVNAITGEVLR